MAALSPLTLRPDFLIDIELEYFDRVAAMRTVLVLRVTRDECTLGDQFLRLGDVL